MKRIHSLTVPVALALALAPARIAAAAPAQGPETIDSILERASARGGPGCAVGIARNGPILVERAFGLAELEHRVRNEPTTVFEAGSASKQFTAAAILLLAADGKLSLGDDVRQYLPELPDYGRTITIDDLLRHTSGLRDWRYLFAMAGWLPGTRVHTNADALAVAARQRGLNHVPRAEYLYTNTGYTLAAIIVQRVSGKTFAEFTDERFFRPLAMGSTRWREDFRRVVKGRARAYTAERQEWVEDMPFENEHGAGGLLTTIGDLLVWNEALRSNRLGQKLTDQLQERTVLANGEQANYARGLFVERRRDLLEVSHGGSTRGYRSWIGRYPDHGLSVAVLCNSDGANPAELARALADVYLPAPAESVPAAVPQAAAPAPAPAMVATERWKPTDEELRQLTGRYASDEIGATYSRLWRRAA
jgi:CubicO group peptidase (beta-lactamase class C family)